MEFKSLLPPNATQLERDIEQALLPNPQIEAAIQQLKGLKLNPPDALLPWLAWEYGLLAIVPYLPDLRIAIREGLQWQKERGTELGIRRALGWVGIAPEVYEEEIPGVHWKEIQLDIGVIPTDQQIEAIKALTKLSARAITKLARLYHGYDIRRLMWDDSNWGDIYSNYSGVLKDGVWLSFGRKHSTANEQEAPQLSSARSKLISFTGAYDDRQLWDHTQYGELPVANYPAIRGRLSTLNWSQLETQQPIHVSRFSRDAHIWSESHYDESWYEPRVCTISGDADIWGDAHWSENPKHIQCDPIDQFIDHQINISNANEPDYAATISAYSSLTVASVNEPLTNTAIAMLSHNHLPASSEMVGQYWTDTTWPKSTWQDTNTITGVAHHGNTD